MSSSKSILGQYSDSKMSKKQSSEQQAVPPMATYEQRYKGMVKAVTAPVPAPTLEQKIKARENPVVEEKPVRVPVVIGGTRYLLGTSEEMSVKRINKIANIANALLEEAKSTNPGLTNSKAAILALIDASDEILSLKTEISNLKTELMYYQQQDFINKSAIPVEPTPMEKLAEAKGNQDKNE
ncbi:MAG: cell division protein ZapA [Clostridia bacterium]|nr:cell division protein ZapA [Clostridia bacterium]